MKILSTCALQPLKRLATLVGGFAVLGWATCTGSPLAAASTGNYRVVGYMPDWQGDVTAVQYGKLTHVCYAFLQANTNGSLDMSGVTVSRLQQLTTLAHANGTKVLISLGGWSNGTALTTAMRNSSARSTLASNTLNFISQYSLDGFDFDWEGPANSTDAGYYNTFMQTMYNSLHPLGKLTTTAIATWYGDYVPAASFAYMDFANLMAYDNEGAQHSDYNFAVTNMNYWIAKGLPASKAVLGVPFYGYASSDSSHSSEVAYNTLCASDPNAQNSDYSGGVYYNGIPTMQQKTNYVVSQGAGGIMIWELSEDATGSKSLLSAIYTILSGSNPVTYTLTANAGAGGTISPGGSVSVSGGGNQTFTITPAAGYLVSAVSVDGASVGAVTSYTFSNVQAAHSISASFSTAPVSSNLALGKTATSSSVETTDFPAALAVDGNTGTRWSSTFADPAWIAIDLGSAKTLNRVVLRWEAAYGKAYQIQTSSDNSTWNTVYTKTAGAGGTEDFSFPASTARYIRMYGTSRGTVYGYSLYEFEVYGSSTTQFAITASAGANGAISPSGSVSVAGGSSQTFTITPANGYVVNAVSVDGANVGAVGSYTFGGVTAAHTISATFIAIPGPAGYTWCAGENGSFTLPGTCDVAYGANGSFNYLYGKTGTITFNNATFGDPLSGVAKSGFYKPSATQYAITASAGANGTISPSGNVNVTGGSSQTFTITPATGYVISTVTVDGANVGAAASYTFSNVAATHTISAAFAACGTSSNIAPSGVAYGWSKNTTATSNGNAVAMPGLNNNNLTTDVAIQSAGDAVNAWEAAGVLWASPVNITSVVFINGTVNSGGDGYLEANARLQFSTDGSTWVDSAWTLSPAYPYTSSASAKTYTFTGTAVSGVKGARVAGQVRVKDGSYFWIVKEVQVIGSTGGSVNTYYTISASAGANGSITPGGSVAVLQGTSQTFAITPSAGYVVNAVTVDGSSVGAVTSYTFSNVVTPHAISATFKSLTNTYTIAASAGAGGTISPSGSVNVASGGSQTFTVTANPGYAVNAVIVDGGNLGAITSYTFSNVQAAHTISATFNQNPGTCSAAPAVPTGLASSSQTSSSVTLTWNAVTAPANCSVTYNVYQNGNKVLTVPTTSAVISGLSASTSYAFTLASVDSFGVSALGSALNVATQAGSYTAAQVLAGVQAHMTAAVQVNSKPHINTMTRAQNVNVYQVTAGVYAYTSSMAIDTDGSDPDPDPDHQGQTTWQDNSGKALGAHTVPFYVLGDDCWDRTSPCPHFYYAERSITGLQFALMFYNGKCIGAVFGDTQTANNQTTSDNDSRELGEASAKAADLLGIPSSGTTGGVDDGVTLVIFSGSQWVVKGSSSAALNTNAQALVVQALNTLGSKLGL